MNPAFSVIGAGVQHRVSLAYIAAKLSLGYSLLEIKNSITRLTACYEPSLDYCVVKIPRWDLRKFPMVNDKLGSSMKSVGEVMSISRSFEEAFQKALRMANENILGFYGTDKHWQSSEDQLRNPNNDRINHIANSFYSGQYDVEEMYNLTRIDKWYLKKMWKIIELQKTLEANTQEISKELLYRAKRIGFSDYQISKMIRKTEIHVRELREEHAIRPVVKQLTRWRRNTLFHKLLIPQPAMAITAKTPLMTDCNGVGFWCS